MATAARPSPKSSESRRRSSNRKPVGA
jgi:hypothetical protein